MSDETIVDRFADAYGEGKLWAHLLVFVLDSLLGLLVLAGAVLIIKWVWSV